MKKSVGLGVLTLMAVGAVFALRNRADAAQFVPLVKVLCKGTAGTGSTGCCNETGPREFVYEVQPSGGASVTFLEVGVHDATLSDYSNPLLPTGWAMSIVDRTPPDHPGVCTPHGGQSSETNTCPIALVFSGPAMTTTFQVGYDFLPDWDVHDVGWRTTGGIKADWGRPVGKGNGPIHSPQMP